MMIKDVTPADAPAGASLKARVKAALALKDKTVTSWAREDRPDAERFFDTEVWANLAGRRYRLPVRRAIADLLGITVEELDAEIEQSAGRAP